ncbi:enoyl-CoA-hydratase DpgB [Phytohabitans kaempferiae]|uniref:Enoyl-CoA-hydratase DpgB n=1 Tax=Phytohabitans kaempferiae TaxID=1620943 RepID=A0ABV6LZC9_9ACTN
MTRRDEFVVSVDGERPLSAEAVAVVAAACDAAEDASRYGAADAHVVVHVSGTPGPAWAAELTVGLVSKWERALRRLERLPMATVAVATGDCGGPALDALLATDHRVAATSTRLLLPVSGGGTWPGMAVYRLARQAANAAAIRRAVLFGVPLEVADALAAHLVHEVTDDVAGALARAARLAAAVSGTELAVRRQLMFDAPTVSFEDALGAHLAACDRALRRAGAWPAA